MSQDERDYYYDPKRFRSGSSPAKDGPSYMSESDYWRRKSKEQQQSRNVLILGICLLALGVLFADPISSFLKNLTSEWQQAKPQLPDTVKIVPPRRNTTSELQFPESGSTIQYQTAAGTTASFTVISERGKTDNCVVKLETWSSGIPVIELFVRAGEQGETQAVPLGEYRVKIACGDRWYGRSEMFGRGTSTSIGESPLLFSQTGNRINGSILTLTKRIDGNFKTQESRFNSF